METQQERQTRIDTLRTQIAKVEKVHGLTRQTVVRSGLAVLDGLLPERGFRRGTISEWLVVGEGSGVVSLALRVAARAARDGGAVVVFDQAKSFYPPAAIRLGLDAASLIVVEAVSPADHAWALDQALRCSGGAAVLAWPDKLDSHTFRRLQLAAEEGGGLGLLIRPEEARHEPSWADVRLLVEPLPMGRGIDARRLLVTLLRCRGGTDGRSVELELNDESHPVSMAAAMADPAPARRAAGV